MSDARFMWKFVLRPWESGTLMPSGAILRHAAAQGDDVCVWAEVNPLAPTVERSILVIPTGGAVDRNAKYIGTAHLVADGEPLVFHVYDLGLELIARDRDATSREQR